MMTMKERLDRKYVRLSNKIADARFKGNVKASVRYKRELADVEKALANIK